MAIALAGCKDDEPAPGPAPVPDGDNVIELSRHTSFHYIETSGTGTWTVSEFPRWAAPMEETGDAGQSVQLFVESNFSDDDRTAALKIRFSDGSEAGYKLVQHGAIADDENGDVLEAGNMRATAGVGYSTNVFKTPNSGKYNVISDSPLNFRSLVDALKAMGEQDALVDEARYFSRIESVTGSSTTALANQLSINAGIEVGVSAFKIGVEGGFSQMSSGNSKCEYAIEEIQHIVQSRHLRQGVLRYCVENGINIFQDDFYELCQEFIGNETDEDLMYEIVCNYGTHIITRGSLGGELKLSMMMKVSDELSGSDIHAALELSSKVINVGGEFNMSNKESAIAESTTITLETFGGSSVFTLAPGADFDTFHKEVKNHDNLEAWVSNIRKGKSLALIDMETFPIYDLMPTPETREALRNYIVGAYQTRCYSTTSKPYPGPDLYVLRGFSTAGNEKLQSSVYIPEIDVEVLACRELMPELSPTEYSTVIYSGTEGNVSTDRGFFIGSATRKPCKFKRDRSGKFTTEEFTHLKEGEITELYVDATGNITIFPKGVTDLYRTVQFPEFDYEHVDLSKVASRDLVISKSVTLVGRSNVDNLCVRIKPDVTVRLSGVTLGSDVTGIYGHILCEGNAKIELVKNTDNLIYGRGLEGGEPGIRAGRPGTTLIIDGPGSLKVYGNASAIGPRAGYSEYAQECGDIIINGGDISAIGLYAPGIGACYNSGCGNITINGGNIYAESTIENFAGTPSSAIGAGSLNSECGDIFISRNITALTAVGRDAINVIGRGHASSKCGTVVIEDPAKVTQRNA